MEKRDSIYDVLGEFITHKKGIIKERVITEDVPIAILSEAPIFALFMSANWCPPCKGLIPCLKKFYEEVNSSRYDGIYKV